MRRKIGPEIEQKIAMSRGHGSEVMVPLGYVSGQHGITTFYVTGFGLQHLLSVSSGCNHI